MNREIFIGRQFLNIFSPLYRQRMRDLKILNDERSRQAGQNAAELRRDLGPFFSIVQGLVGFPKTIDSFKKKFSHFLHK